MTVLTNYLFLISILLFFANSPACFAFQYCNGRFPLRADNWLRRGLLTDNNHLVQRVPRLKVSSCPVFDDSKHGRANTRKSGKKELKESTAAAPPKLLSRISAVGFLVASLRGKPHKYLEKLRKKHGENFIIQPNIVVLNDPHAIRDVLETHNLPKTPKVRFGYKSIFYGNRSRSSGGILAAPWKKWIEQRRMATPALSECTLGSLASKFYQVSLPFFSYLDEMAASKQPVDMSAAFTAVTMDTIGMILLGKSFGMCNNLKSSKQEVPFAAALHTLTDEAVRQMVLPGWWLKRRAGIERVESARGVIDDFLEDCIDARSSENKRSNQGLGGENTTTDLLNILLEAESIGAISREEVKGQLLQFVFAGFDTLAPTLTYMLWEISQNNNLQDDLVAEAKHLLPERDDFPVDSGVLIRELSLLDNTFMETNRKHPAAAMGTSRKVGKSKITVGDGIDLPADSNVLISPWTLHRNEKYWRDPETFDPSRFERNDAVVPFSFQPFSGGPRNCIGTKLARTEALSLFAPLLRRFEVQCKERQVPDDYFSLTRRPRKRVMFILAARRD